MNNSSSIKVETRVHVYNGQAPQNGYSAGVCLPSFTDLSEAKRKLKEMEIKLLQQEKMKQIKRFILTLSSTIILGLYLYSHYVSEELVNTIMTS